MKLRSAIGLTIFSFLSFGSLIAKANVIAERNANFKAIVATMRPSNAALGGGDYDAAINQAITIAAWARVMPNYFQENSDMAVTRRADIYIHIDGFKSLASANEKAALTLISMAKIGGVSATIGALKQLGGTCESCHINFKNSA